MYSEVDGDLVKLALEGKFNVVVQGNNCFCTQGSGLAPQFVKAFNTDKFKMEEPQYRGDINKLGTIDYEKQWFPKPTPIGINFGGFSLYVVNSYTQYNFGSYREGGDVKAPADYEAITMVMRKLNKVFKGKHIGLPKIGAGLAGGDWEIIKGIIQKELVDCDVTLVNYKP